MHNLRTPISWTLANCVSACIAILAGYALAWVTTIVITMLLFFLWIIGAAIGVLVGSVIGGAFVGWVTGQVQQRILSEQQFPSQQLLIKNICIWAIAGGLCVSTFMSISAGDVAPLLPILLVAALIASGIQWTTLITHLVPGAMWLGSLSVLGTATGTLLGLFIIGAWYGRLPNELLAGFSPGYTSITEVQINRLVVLNGRLLVFISVEDDRRNVQWELWSSDGTGEGTNHVKTISTGWNEAKVYDIAIVDNQLYFEAHGTENPRDAYSYLNTIRTWVTDGTSSGTRVLSNPLPQGLEPQASPVWVEQPQLVQGTTLYFVVQKSERRVELWRRNVTSGQETRVKTFP